MALFFPESLKQDISPRECRLEFIFRVDIGGDPMQLGSALLEGFREPENTADNTN
jgi:hypothetical protein